MARLLGIAIVVVAGYLAYLASREPAAALLCFGGAAAIAVAGVVLLWNRPNVGAAIAACALATGIVAHTIVVAKPAPTGPTAAAATPSGFPSMQPASGALSAPQPGGFDYSDFIGHGTIDDGTPTADVTQQTTHAVSAAAAAFGGPTPTPLESQTAQKLLDDDAKLPASEYSLPDLAQTLPNDPIAIYRFVRDSIAIDPYDGIMRGPLGTWMSRAGSPSDKLALLAWLMVHKHVPIQFVRGTLSADERNRVVASAVSLPDDPSAQPTPNATEVAAIDAYAKDGEGFAQWSSHELASSHIALGSGNAPQVSSRHYWIQIDQNGKVFDLDPTLPDMNDGQHLGTLDPSFKPWAMLPDDEWHYVRIAITAFYRDGTQQQVVAGSGKTCDLAYSPIRLAFVPSGGSDLPAVAAARKFNVVLVAGTTALGPQAQLDLDAHGGISRVTMEIDRKDSDGQQLSSTRNLLAAGTPQPMQGPALAGLTSMLVVPGVGLNAFEVHMYVRTMAALANAIEDAAGQMTPPPVYPIPIAEYFASDENVAGAIVADTNGRFYRNRPNVVLERTWYSMTSGSPRLNLGFDIVDNGMSAVGMDGAQAAVANLARGYADTKIESDVIRSDGGFSTIAVFGAGAKPEVIAAGGSAPAGLGDFAEGLSETLGSGHAAIAAAAPVMVSGQREYGWWDVDPSTGSAVGRMTGGAGEAAVDYGFLLNLYSGLMDAHEVWEAANCEGAEACKEAECGWLVSQGLMFRSLRHWHHVRSPYALLAGILIDVQLDVLAQFALCGKSSGGGEHGGGEHGGTEQGGGGGPPEDGRPYE